MNCTHLPFNAGQLFSKFDIDYTMQSPDLRAFYLHEPSLSGLHAAMEIRESYQTNRTALVDVFKKQYQTLSRVPSSVMDTINSLEEDSVYTVTTAHQPVLFTGPIYFIYKAISAITLATKLNKSFADKKIVPVMVIGGEDHDKEEINHLHLFGKKIEWKTEQEGATGRFSLAGLDEVLNQLYEILGSNTHAEELKELLQLSFAPGRSYGAAMQDFVQLLLGQYGLLVLNMDEPVFKKLFIPIIKDELFHNRGSEIIGHTQEAIESAGYKSATFLRDINLFYLENGRRERIERTDNTFTVQNGGPSFTKDEILALVDSAPERFSPNVNMRPLFQELILPNLAYIGGGGELAYWIERLAHFNHYGIPFPVLIRRDSFFWIDGSLSKKMQNLSFSFTELLPETDQIISAYLERVTQNDLHIEGEKEHILKSLHEIAEKGGLVDHTLKPAFEAEAMRILKSLESMESRIVRAEKQKHEIAINQIKQLKEKLFPNNGLQERHDNFMGFYLKYGRNFFEEILRQSDPLRSELKIILDEG